MNTQKGNASPLLFLYQGTAPNKALLKRSFKHEMLQRGDAYITQHLSESDVL